MREVRNCLKNSPLRDLIRKGFTLDPIHFNTVSSV